MRTHLAHSMYTVDQTKVSPSYTGLKYLRETFTFLHSYNHSIIWLIFCTWMTFDALYQCIHTVLTVFIVNTGHHCHPLTLVWSGQNNSSITFICAPIIKYFLLRIKVYLKVEAPSFALSLPLFTVFVEKKREKNRWFTSFVTRVNASLVAN